MSSKATTAHTPGPWGYTPERIDPLGWVAGRGPKVHSAKGVGICNVQSGDGKQAEAEANAQLIASAPELLMALKYALDYMNPADPATDAIVALIAKAEGVSR